MDILLSRQNPSVWNTVWGKMHKERTENADMHVRVCNNNAHLQQLFQQMSATQHTNIANMCTHVWCATFVHECNNRKKGGMTPSTADHTVQNCSTNQKENVQNCTPASKHLCLRQLPQTSSLIAFWYSHIVIDLHESKSPAMFPKSSNNCAR